MTAIGAGRHDPHDPFEDSGRTGAGSQMRRKGHQTGAAGAGRLAVVGAVTVVTVVLLRLWQRRARRTRRRWTGAGPAVTATDGVRLHTRLAGPHDAAPVGVTTDAGSREGPVNQGGSAPTDAPTPTVVLVHGFASGMQEWDRQLGALVSRARVVTYDQRGHGLSGWAGRPAATIDQLGRDLGAVVDACATSGPVVVVGHSMGGMAVLSLARQRPDLIGPTIVGAGLVSTAAAALDRDILSGVVGGALRRSGVADRVLDLVWTLGPLLDRLTPFGTPAGRRLLRRWLFRGPVPDAAVTRMQDLVAGTSDTAAAAFLPSVLRHDERAALPVLRDIPTLVVAGAEDATIPACHARALAGALGPRSRLVVVPGAGHMVNLTRPEPVNRALRELLARSCAARGGVHSPTGSGEQ